MHQDKLRQNSALQKVLKESKVYFKVTLKKAQTLHDKMNSQHNKLNSQHNKLNYQHDNITSQQDKLNCLHDKLNSSDFFLKVTTIVICSANYVLFSFSQQQWTKYFNARFLKNCTSKVISANGHITKLVHYNQKDLDVIEFKDQGLSIRKNSKVQGLSSGLLIFFNYKG